MEVAIGGRDWWEHQSQKWKAVPANRRLYRIGLGLLVAALALAVLPFPAELGSATFVAGATACAGSLALELYAWIAARSEALWFKVLLGPLAVMSGAIATGMASSYVAGATGQEASTFKLAIALVAPLAFVPLLCLAISILGLLSVPVVMFLTLGEELRREAGEPSIARTFGRVTGTIALAVLAAQVPTQSSGIDPALRKLAMHGAFLLDMQENAQCASKPGDRVARVNDEFVVVARKGEDGMVFEQRPCRRQASGGAMPTPASQPQ